MNRAFPECSAANLPGENGARRITPSRASPRGPRLAAFLPLAVKKDSSDSNNILGEAELVQMIPPPLEALGSPLDFNLPQGGFSNTDSVAQQWRCQSVKSIKKSSKVALDPSKFPPVQMSGKELRVSRESAAAAKNEEKGNIVESFGGRVFDTTSFVASNVVGDNYRGNAADVTKGTSDGMRHELDEKGAAVRKLVVKNRKPGRKREKVDVPVAGNTKINGGLLSETAGTAVAHIQTGGLTDRAGTLNGISDRIDFELNLNGCSSALDSVVMADGHAPMYNPGVKPKKPRQKAMPKLLPQEIPPNYDVFDAWPKSFPLSGSGNIISNNARIQSPNSSIRMTLTQPTFGPSASQQYSSPQITPVANRPSFASSMNSSGYGYASSNMNPFVYGHQNSRAAQPFPVSHPFSHQPSGVHVNNLLARQPRHTDAAHEDFVRNGVTFSSRTYYDLDGNALARKGTHPDLIAAREKYGRSTSISLSPLMGQLDIPTQRKLPSDASIKCAVPAQQAPNGEPQKANKTAKGTCKMVFTPYVSVEEKCAGVAAGRYLIGTLVVSGISPDQAYVRIAGKENDDVNICGHTSRNRAFNGDEVVVETFSRSQWKIRPERIEEVQNVIGTTKQATDVNERSLESLLLCDDQESRLDADDARVNQQKREPSKAVSTPKSAGKALITDIQPGKQGSPQKQGRMWMDSAIKHVGLQYIPDHWLQKTGRIVFIESSKGCRDVVGQLRLSPLSPRQSRKAPKARQSLTLYPLDVRMPSVHIPPVDQSCGIPDELWSEWEKDKDLLFLARIVDWDSIRPNPQGRVVKKVGSINSASAHTAAIMVENGISEEIFPSSELHTMMSNLSGEAAEEKLKYREDIRRDCVFTIDPPDAKDLDDAVSCVALGNGLFRVGVHIADVAFYVEEDTPLDHFVRKRATTVYMIDKVVHMLPSEMVNAHCSLDPGKDRRAFSVSFLMTEEGEVMDHHISRTLIHSCAKLSYRQAQDVIDNPEEPWMGPHIEENAFVSVEKIKRTILDLMTITQNLRTDRFRKGGLRIDQPEFRFQLDSNGMPIAMNLQEHWESCQLIEELALLTNMTVAKTLFKHYPDLSLLRRHVSPLDQPLLDMQKRCQLAEIDMDIRSAKTIQESMNDALLQHSNAMPVLSYLCAKPMKLADYVCSGLESDTWHYALGIEHYTHMTSPIRRYADIVVHRLLSSVLGYSSPPKNLPEEIQKIADTCNERRVAAGRCQEASWNLFLGFYIRNTHLGTMKEPGVVVAVYGASLSVDILVSRLALSKRIFIKQQDGVKRVAHRVQGKKRHVLDVEWVGGKKREIGVWTEVEVCLSVPVDEDNPRNIKITLEAPK